MQVLFVFCSTNCALCVSLFLFGSVGCTCRWAARFFEVFAIYNCLKLCISQNQIHYTTNHNRPKHHFKNLLQHTFSFQSEAALLHASLVRWAATASGSERRPSIVYTATSVDDCGHFVTAKIICFQDFQVNPITITVFSYSPVTARQTALIASSPVLRWIISASSVR